MSLDELIGEEVEEDDDIGLDIDEEDVPFDEELISQVNLNSKLSAQHDKDLEDLEKQVEMLSSIVTRLIKEQAKAIDDESDREYDKVETESTDDKEDDSSTFGWDSE
jgi:hypothetical protein